MACIVLMGFSTVGKSTLGRRLAEEFGDRIEILDSDVFVAQEYDGHIYNIFFRLTDGVDTKPAMKYIFHRQDDFLDSIVETQNSQVVIAGPWLHKSKSWSFFCERMKPTCVFIKISPPIAVQGLLKRRRMHEATEVGQHPLFGCWDGGVTTEYSSSEQRWTELSQSQAADNVARLMRNAHYEKYADVTIPYEAIESEKLTTIRKLLEL